MPYSLVSEELLDMPTSRVQPVEQLGRVYLRHDVSSSRGQLASDEKSSLSVEEAVKNVARAINEERQGVIDQRILKKLSTLDREVRNHELAHAIVGGRYTGTPHYEYERGPDGIHYAVAGDVSINTHAINGRPEMTIEKARVIQKAALAPAEPSVQDHRVAMEAVRMEAEAHLELLAIKTLAIEQLTIEQLTIGRRTLEKFIIEKIAIEKITIEKESRAEMLAKATGNARDVKEENIMPLQENPISHRTIDHFMHVENRQKDDAMDVINQAQENVFTAINRDLMTQLAVLDRAQQAPKSLGGIIHRLA
jgi:hypothetical protein